MSMALDCMRLQPIQCGHTLSFVTKTVAGKNVQERVVQVLLGCPSKLVSIRNNRNWNRNQFRHYPKQNVCFGCFASVPKQRVSMFRLNRNKQKTNRNSLVGCIFCYFYRKFRVFPVFSVFSVVFVFFHFFRFFRVVSKHFVSVVSLLYRNREFRCFN